MKAKKEKIKLPMSLTKRIVLFLLAVALIWGIGYLVYYFVHYVWYDGYEKYLSGYDYEEASELKLVTESNPDVPGMQLVAESEYLKLYTDVSMASVAVYDKRDGSITYSNPQNADEDSVANRNNRNYLKSQLQVYYYNSAVTSANFDSYSKSVQTKQFDYEGIKNGIRYIYTIGEKQDKNGAEGIHFIVPLEYRLEKDSLVVSIPASGIQEFGSASIYRIRVLPYFGAASGAEEGYLVVPSGSGSLIRFNNGKKAAANYSQYIYDIDPLTSTYTTTENVDGARLPLFGICRTDRSVLVTVEDGASTALISAGISGVYNDYNYAYATFVTRNADNLRIFGNSSQDVAVLEPALYDVNYTVRYTFLGSEHTGYTGIANYYREKLIAEGVLVPKTESGDVPLYYDVIAGIKKSSHFLGIQRLHTYAMTTFEEAAQIAEDLSASGVSNQVMNLQGWFNGGYYNNAPDRVRVLKKLGGRAGLEKLEETMNSLGGRLFADVVFQQITYADNGFRYSAEASRYYGVGYVVSFGLVNPTTLRNTAGLGYSENMYDLLSPKFLPRYVEKFSRKAEGLDIYGLSLRDLTNCLYSDKRRTNMISREDALKIVEGQLAVLKSTGKSLMGNASNGYAFGFLTDIINVPVDDNAYIIVDESIPLYQMILHGCVSYAGKLMNFENTQVRKTEILEMIETGTAPHFVFTWENSNEMKNTGLNRYYATTYTTWKESAVEIWRQVNEALKQVSGAQMTNHEILAEGVRRVTYSNGVAVYVNYNEEAYTADGITVPGMSYRLEGN